jgi:hypothetical protein
LVGTNLIPASMVGSIPVVTALIPSPATGTRIAGSPGPIGPNVKVGVMPVVTSGLESTPPSVPVVWVVKVKPAGIVENRTW